MQFLLILAVLMFQTQRTNVRPARDICGNARDMLINGQTKHMYASLLADYRALFTLCLGGLRSKGQLVLIQKNT